MSNSTQPSLAGRAVLALALMIGFYVLALGVAGALLVIPYAELRYGKRLHAKLAIVCVAGAGVILWSIVPRRDKFVPPGPPIDRKKHPKFYQELERIAAATGQPVPEEAYLEMDVNAWVSQRDGFMGFGGRRVMAVGLPLLRILTVSQLRGVLGHEFGHYHGGDTKLGPWIYKTHEALFRTVEKLAESGSALRHVFIAYAKLFLRVSNAISRRQELAADQLAARIVGSRAFGEGLRAVHQGGLAYQTYFRNECVPAFGNGFRPPLAEGFARFLSSKTIADAIDEAMGREAHEKNDPYRTHPPLHERLEAIASIPAEPGPEAPPPVAGDPPALSLMENVDALEDQLLRAVFDAREVAKLKPIRWEDVGTQVYVPLWTKATLEAKARLTGLTPALLPDRLPELERLGRDLLGPKPIDKKDARAHGASVLGAALAVALVRQGWSLHADPGDRVTLEQGGASVSPFTLFDDLAEKTVTVDQWRALCAGAGISDLDLAAPSDEGSGKA